MKFLQLTDLRARQLLQLRILLRLLMEAHIELGHLLDRVAGHQFLIAPILVSVDHLAELRPPVADVIVSDHPVAQTRVDIIKRLPDDGRAEMPHVHRLGDVDRGIVDDHRLALSQPAASVFFSLIQDGEHILVQRDGIDIKIDESRPGHLHLREQLLTPLVPAQLRGQFFRQFARLTAEALSQ